jgi:hypothetical protein
MLKILDACPKGEMKSVKLLCITACLLIIFSCKSITHIWDETIPESEMATILWINNNIKTYNDMPVDWSNIGYGRTLKIPAGETHLVMNLDWSMEFTKHNKKKVTYCYLAEDIHLNYNFLAGNSYNIYLLISPYTREVNRSFLETLFFGKKFEVVHSIEFEVYNKTIKKREKIELAEEDRASIRITENPISW